MTRYVRGLIVALVIGLVLGAAPPAMADLVIKDSSAFNHQYNGDVTPVPNYTETGAFQLGPSTDGDIMTFRTGFGPTLDATDWSGAATPNGWTIEFRIKVGTDFAEGTLGAVTLYTGNGSAGDFISVGGSSTKILANPGLVVDSNDNTDGFHTFRVAFDNQSGVYPYTTYRDGQLLASYPNGGNYGTDNLEFGSGGSLTGGPTVELDYLRWDNTGAYAPIPEPVSLALLGAGGLLLAIARHSRQRR